MFASILIAFSLSVGIMSYAYDVYEFVKQHHHEFLEAPPKRYSYYPECQNQTIKRGTTITTYPEIVIHNTKNTELEVCYTMKTCIKETHTCTELYRRHAIIAPGAYLRDIQEQYLRLPKRGMFHVEPKLMLHSKIHETAKRSCIVQVE